MDSQTETNAALLRDIVNAVGDLAASLFTFALITDSASTLRAYPMLAIEQDVDALQRDEIIAELATIYRPAALRLLKIFTPAYLDKYPGLRNAENRGVDDLGVICDAMRAEADHHRSRGQSVPLNFTELAEARRKVDDANAQVVAITVRIRQAALDGAVPELEKLTDRCGEVLDQTLQPIAPTEQERLAMEIVKALRLAFAALKMIGLCRDEIVRVGESEPEPALPDPIGNADLTRRAGLADADDVSRQVQDALHAASKAVPKVSAGHGREWTHDQLRSAYPHLRDGKLKDFLHRSGLANLNQT